jgi:hypothetical protein
MLDSPVGDREHRACSHGLDKGVGYPISRQKSSIVSFAALLRRRVTGVHPSTGRTSSSRASSATQTGMESPSASNPLESDPRQKKRDPGGEASTREGCPGLGARVRRRRRPACDGREDACIVGRRLCISCWYTLSSSVNYTLDFLVSSIPSLLPLAVHIVYHMTSAHFVHN